MEIAYPEIVYRVNPEVSSEALNSLFATAWEGYVPGDFTAILKHSLAYVCAYEGDKLVGFVNVAWDGGIHAFLLDTTVHRDVQHRGIGTVLVQQAAAVARERGIEWLHVDFEPQLTGFYRGCGFKATEAGLMNLKGLKSID
ncbi:MAG TPA: GNAT family N-acetyltransferase [Phototrophicaceae bacterium]|nr:GNAT family N-acetyltransferase [Phototrophicaceae bacterium]